MLGTLPSEAKSLRLKRISALFGETTDREEAFSDFEDFEIAGAQDKFGFYTRYGSERKFHFTKATMPRHLHRANPRCQQGGLDLQRIVLFSTPGQHTFHCNGHEGSPKGRRKGDPCDNSFQLTLSVERRDTLSEK